MAIVLASLLRELDASSDASLLKQLLRQAARIAVNRTVAGVHFPADSIAGAALGVVLGKYLIGRGTVEATTTIEPTLFDGHEVKEDSNFTSAWLEGLVTSANPMDIIFASDTAIVKTIQSEGAVASNEVPAGKMLSPELKWLWDAAAAEWKG